MIAPWSVNTKLTQTRYCHRLDQELVMQCAHDSSASYNNKACPQTDSAAKDAHEINRMRTMKNIAQFLVDNFTLLLFSTSSCAHLQSAIFMLICSRPFSCSLAVGHFHAHWQLAIFMLICSRPFSCSLAVGHFYAHLQSAIFMLICSRPFSCSLAVGHFYAHLQSAIFMHICGLA